MKNYSNKKNKNTLFIPGPVTTSKSVKKIVSYDFGSRDLNIVETIKNIRSNLLKIVNANSVMYSAILFQGTGTYANESVLGSLPENTNLGILSNGIYGNRLHHIADKLNINNKLYEFDYNKKLDLKIIEKKIKYHTHIAFVHNETTLGTLNELDKIVNLLKEHNKIIIVDAVSSFGGIPIDLKKTPIDFLIASSNKCLHSYPGISFVIAKKKILKKYTTSKSLSLDLYSQWREFELNNQFRFTPPVQMIKTLNVAIKELLDEGVNQRHNKYIKYNQLIRKTMNDIGLESIIDCVSQGPICQSFYYPYDNFDYNELYHRLNKHNIVIYTASFNNKNVLRLGNIGDINMKKFKKCVNIIKNEILDMIVKHS